MSIEARIIEIYVATKSDDDFVSFLGRLKENFEKIRASF